MILELHYQHPGLTEQDRELAEAVVSALGDHVSLVASGTGKTVNVVIVDTQFIRVLNRDYRNRDQSTDVLSFPLSAPGEEEELLGEVYICWEKAIAQAREYEHSINREFAYLLVHGLLHLLGYEHGPEPNPKMRAREEEILSALELERMF